MQYGDGELSLLLNGEELATVYFGIWLGEQPIDDGLRRALLGGGPERDA